MSRSHLLGSIHVSVSFWFPTVTRRFFSNPEDTLFLFPHQPGRRRHADRTTRAFFQRLSRLDVLLVDEFGYLSAPDPQQFNDFFRLMDDRCNRKSTIITTNLGYDEWGKFLGNGPLVAALLSRISELSGAATPLRLAEQRLAAHTTKDLLHHFAGESLLRTDLNPANILVNAGQARIVDWSWATRGTAWLDAAYWVSWLIAAGHTPNQAESWAAQVPAWHTAPPKAITAFAEANAKIWAESSAPSPDPWTSKIVTASKSWSQHRR